MEFLRPLLTLCFAAMLFLGMLLFFRRLHKSRDETAKRYIQNAEKEGRKVTAYIQTRKRYAGDNDASRQKLKKPFQTARYAYFAPDGQKLETKRYTGSPLPDEIILYLDPGDPKKYRTEKELFGENGLSFLGVLGYAAIFAAAALWYKMLGLFLP